MKTLPLALVLEKNRLATPNPWLALLDLTIPGVATPVRVARNTENVTFQGNVYTAFPFELEQSRESSRGEIPTLSLRLSNASQALQAYLESYDGLDGATVVLRVVNAAYLAENYSELDLYFDVLSASADAQWITFSLGAPSPLRDPFPPKRYLPLQCNWLFKSAECGYSGLATVCGRTLDYCRQLSNSKRFGGFPGLSGGGVRLA